LPCPLPKKKGSQKKPIGTPLCRIIHHLK